MTALLTFLLSGAGRWFLAEIIEYMKRREERVAIEREAQAAHLRKREEAEWQAAAVQRAAEAGIQLVGVQSDADARRAADSAFERAVAATATPIQGNSRWVEYVNIANASVRPVGAYWALVILTVESLTAITLGAFALEIAAAFLGLFVGGRIQSTGR
jgi:hypothetical protein